MERAPSNAHMFGDGSRAIKNEALALQLVYKEVVHALLEFSRDVTLDGQEVIAGTQSVDWRWDILDTYIPQSVHSTVKRQGHNCVNPELLQYTWAWQWRVNQRRRGKDLLDSFGELCACL